VADVQPLRALHYDLAKVGALEDVMAPPYDVIDEQQRQRLLERSEFNVVAVDLPRGEPDPYAHAAEVLAGWQRDGAIARDTEPALWALDQSFAAPDGRTLTRSGFLARVRVEDYGPGRIRPHERTHPGPKEDRLRLTRATRANLSPIFSLFDDEGGRVATALAAATSGATPWAQATDDDATHNRLWRLADPDVIADVGAALRETELLIADGHHRYETARVYADEIGGEGAHRYVLMHLVALQDDGLAVFPTHRLVSGLAGDAARQEALAATLRDHFTIEELDDTALLAPPQDNGPLTLGYIDSHFRRPFRLTLKDQAIADTALAHMPPPYRRLDTAVLEELILKGPLALTEDDISHLRGLGYSRTDQEALELVLEGPFDAAFFLRPGPVAQVQAIAAAGVNMPPKSTFFYPKVPTGLVFNPLA
jgi:uncharacterized protein (DUF1015 family)